MQKIWEASIFFHKNFRATRERSATLFIFHIFFQSTRVITEKDINECKLSIVRLVSMQPSEKVGFKPIEFARLLCIRSFELHGKE